MTIDEVIEELKSENGYYANNGMTDVAEFNTKIIRLLEKLKELREYFNSTEIGKYRFQKGYNKAIDDFVNACKSNSLYQTFGLRQSDIEKIAEQLKAGVTND